MLPVIGFVVEKSLDILKAVKGVSKGDMEAHEALDKVRFENLNEKVTEIHKKIDTRADIQLQVSMKVAEDIGKIKGKLGVD